MIKRANLCTYLVEDITKKRRLVGKIDTVAV